MECGGLAAAFTVEPPKNCRSNRRVEQNGRRSPVGVESRAGETRMLRITMLAAGLISLLLCLGTPTRSDLGWQGAVAPAPQLGQVNFPTSCAAEPSIETGVALLHSFQYEQADQSFSDAEKRDSKCAMAYWGKAVSRYEQIWEFPSEKTVNLGAQDIRRAQTLGASTERERGYIAAAAARCLSAANC